MILTLAGCGTTTFRSAWRDADARAAAAFADCDAQLRSGILHSYREAVECARPRVIAAYARNGFPYMDLVLFDLQEREIGAERVDSGAASPAAVEHDIATLERRLRAERERRIAARSGIGGAAPATPPQQLLAGLNALAGPGASQQGANCFKVGGFVHCNPQP